MVNNTNPTAYKIRNVQQRDLETIKSWMVNEHWNPGSYDVNLYFRSLKEHFFILTSSENSEVPLGCILAPQYKQHLGFVGLFIVAPEHRKKGLGAGLWNHAMEHLSGRNVTLYAVEQQTGRYQKEGFQKKGFTTRYDGRGKPTPIPYDVPTRGLRTLKCPKTEHYDSFEKYNQAAEKHKADLEKVSQWMSRHIKHIDVNFSRILLNDEQVSHIVKMDPEGEISGLAFIRPCHDGQYRLSVFANNAASATALTKETMRQTNFDGCQRDNDYSSSREIGLFMDTVSPESSTVVSLANKIGFFKHTVPGCRVMQKTTGDETPDHPDDEQVSHFDHVGMLSLEAG